MQDELEPDFSLVPLEMLEGDWSAVRGALERLHVPDENSARQAALAVLGAIVMLHVPETAPPQVFGPERLFEALAPASLKLLVRRVQDIPAVWLRARVLHVAWLRKRSCAFSQAEDAVRLYIQHSDQVFDPAEWTASWDAASLAVRLGASLRKGACYEASLDHVEALLRRLAGRDPLYFSDRLLRLLHEHGRSSALWADWAVGCAEAFPNDPHRAVEYYEVASLLYRGCKDEVSADRAVVSVAASYERLAASSDVMCRPGFLNQALTAYRSVGGQKVNAERVTREIREASRESVRSLKRVDVGTVFIGDLMDRARKHVDSPDFFDALVRMALLRQPPEVDAIRDQVVAAHEGALLHRLMASVPLAPDGRVLAESGEAESWPNEADLHRHTMGTQEFFAQSGILPAAQQVCDAHAPTLAEVVRICGASPFVPNDQVHLFSRGILDGIWGDFEASTYRLVPLLENGIRSALEKAGATVNLVRDTVERYKPLESLLAMPEAERLFGPAWCYDLRVLLCAQTGFNLRNNVAHGLTTDPPKMHYVYAWWTALRLVVLTLATGGAYTLAEAFGEDGGVEPEDTSPEC